MDLKPNLNRWLAVFALGIIFLILGNKVGKKAERRK